MADNRYPGNRSPEEVKRSLERAKELMDKQRKKEREVDVSWAKWALIIIGGLQILYALYFWQKTDIVEVIIIDGGLGAAFVGLAVYSNQNPFQALTIGLILYVAVAILAALFTGLSIFSGIIVKIIVVSILLSGIKAAKKMPNVKEVSEELLDDEL